MPSSLGRAMDRVPDRVLQRVLTVFVPAALGAMIGGVSVEMTSNKRLESKAKTLPNYELASAFEREVSAAVSKLDEKMRTIHYDQSATGLDAPFLVRLAREKSAIERLRPELERIAQLEAKYKSQMPQINRFKQSFTKLQAQHNIVEGALRSRKFLKGGLKGATAGLVIIGAMGLKNRKKRLGYNVPRRGRRGA